MDVIAHAVAGAATGTMFGRPLLGAMVAALPDAVLGLQRRKAPSTAYNATHSAIFLLGAAVAAAMLHSGLVGALVALCLLSHIVLDLPTHGEQWAPPLLYPFSPVRFSYGSEWEFFNRSWFNGLKLTILWVLVCLNFVVWN